MTNYLTRAAVVAVLTWITGVTDMGGGAVLVFTYVHAGLLDGSVRFDGGARILENVRVLGEPWTFGLDPADVADFLARTGLGLREDLGADDYRRRCLPAPPRGWGGYAFYRLAVATAEDARR